MAAIDERIARYGERGSGKKALDERHKRELRRHRTDELMAGLTVIAGGYRDALVDGSVRRPDAVAEAVGPHPRGDGSARTQPERSAAAAVAAVVVTGAGGRLTNVTEGCLDTLPSRPASMGG